MLRNKTEIRCDNCDAEIDDPKDIHNLSYFGTRGGTSKIVRAMVCEECADEFEDKFIALFSKA